jgi:hypothetical protein
MVITKLNRSLAKQDPEGTFETRSSSWTRQCSRAARRLRRLTRWRQFILAELAAVGEAKRARLLDEIEEAGIDLAGKQES